MRLSLAFLALLASPAAGADLKYLCRDYKKPKGTKKVCERICGKGTALDKGPAANQCTADSLGTPDGDAPFDNYDDLETCSTGKKSKGKKCYVCDCAPAPSCADLQDGFECGMAPEVTGLWAGDEKFYVDSEETNYDYCTTALFNPANGKNFLTWQSGFLGTGNGTEPTKCMDIGVDALNKTIDGAFLPYLNPTDAYITQLKQKKCLDDCSYDVLTAETIDLTGYTVASKACGAHLNMDAFRPDTFTCELYQTNLIEDGDGNQEVVLVVTYLTYSGGFDNYTCPDKVTFNQTELEADRNAEGTALFVLQANDLTDSFNVTNWDCLAD